MQYKFGILLCLIIIALVPSVSGAAQLAWSVPASGCVTAVDTNSDASKIFVGSADGCITAYNISGIMQWYYQTNTTDATPGIKKIVSTTDGNLVWVNAAHQAGYINSAGTVTSVVNRSDPINITDVAILPDGTAWAMVENPPAKLTLFDPYGTIIATNETVNKNWTKVGYDPFDTWVVTANQSDNKLYFWNVSAWIGWDEFNPLHTATKNTSQLYLDSFPYKSYLNITPTAGSKTITFYNTANTTYIQKINNSYFEYNRANTGSYFLWTVAGDLPSNPLTTQAALLNLSNVSGNYYHVILKAGQGNYTIYYGNTSYAYASGLWYDNDAYVRINYTSSGTFSWTAPVDGTTEVNLTMISAGGGGSSGTDPGAATGNGGSAGTREVHNNTAIVKGQSYSVIVGDGGNGGSGGYNASGGNAGSIGGTTSFGALYSITGGAGGVGTGGTAAGGTGYSGYSPLATDPTGNSGGTGLHWYNCSPGGDAYGYCLQYFYGGSGPNGWGSAGGGGGGTLGGDHPVYGPSYTGPGGDGVSGLILLEFYVHYDVPSLSDLSITYSRNTAIALNQSSTKQYVGSVLGLDVPRDGYLVSLITDDDEYSTGGTYYGGFYRQVISSTGFGTYVLGSPLFTDTPLDVKTSNAGAYIIEARGPDAYIYDYGGTAKAQITSGGVMRSVDIGITSGLLAAYGGDEGKLGIVSREGSSTWYTYYTGSVGTRIDGVAVSWDGNYVVAGRFGKTVELYQTNVTIPVTSTPSYVDVNLRVYKDGAGYSTQPVTIYSSSDPTGSWTPVTTLYTDGSGHLSYTTTTGTYYKFVVNVVGGTQEGEGSAIWQSNTGSTVVQIFVLTPSTPYEWNAYYTLSTHNVTVVYSDSIVPTSVTVTIRDLKTNLLVLSKTYTSTQSFTIEYNDQLQNGSYQVTIVMDRLGSMIRDQRTVTAPNNYNIAIPLDNNIKYAVFTIVLMLIAGMFTYIDSKRGAFAVVVIAALFMLFDLLPIGLMTVAMLAAVFSVMSLFGSRV